VRVSAQADVAEVELASLRREIRLMREQHGAAISSLTAQVAGLASSRHNELVKTMVSTLQTPGHTTAAPPAAPPAAPAPVPVEPAEPAAEPVPEPLAEPVPTKMKASLFHPIGTMAAPARGRLGPPQRRLVSEEEAEAPPAPPAASPALEVVPASCQLQSWQERSRNLGLLAVQNEAAAAERGAHQAAQPGPAEAEAQAEAAASPPHSLSEARFATPSPGLRGGPPQRVVFSATAEVLAAADDEEADRSRQGASVHAPTPVRAAERTPAAEEHEGDKAGADENAARSAEVLQAYYAGLAKGQPGVAPHGRSPGFVAKPKAAYAANTSSGPRRAHASRLVRSAGITPTQLFGQSASDAEPVPRATLPMAAAN
jgi:hypothetical protein